MRWRELEAAATAAMTPEAADYVAGGAGGEETMRANREAFDRWRIVPRMLRDVATRDLSTTVLGTALPAPVLLGPVGVQQIVHPDGELATARAAAQLGVPYVHSTAASTSHRGRRRGRAATARAGSSSTARRPRPGRELRRSAPRRPATRRSSSRSTR